uniref:Uncharacterized protein n=1 Tax=viral metagenome TaxID=1070528 RepID=A0A6C0FDE5_9ZZZZ|tara:strand:- start:16057 stop:16533 length:477 start_codon:yes stop_codon:yes gene_type:complete
MIKVKLIVNEITQTINVSLFSEYNLYYDLPIDLQKRIDDHLYILNMDDVIDQMYCYHITLDIRQILDKLHSYIYLKEMDRLMLEDIGYNVDSPQDRAYLQTLGFHVKTDTILSLITNSQIYQDLPTQVKTTIEDCINTNTPHNALYKIENFANNLVSL